MMPKNLYLTTGSAFNGDKVEFTVIAVAAESSWEAEQMAKRINFQRFGTFLHYGHRLSPMDKIERTVIERIAATDYKRWLYVLTATKAGGDPYHITSVNGIVHAVDEQTRDMLVARNIEHEFPPTHGWANREIAYLEPLPDDVWQEVVG